MDELEILARIKFLKVSGVLPAFANVEEFSEIEDLNDDRRFRKRKLGLIGERIFLFDEGVSKIISHPARSATNKKHKFIFLVVKIPKALLGENRFERIGKRIWMTRISSMPESSLIRIKYLEIAHSRKGIEK